MLTITVPHRHPKGSLSILASFLTLVRQEPPCFLSSQLSLWSFTHKLRLHRKVKCVQSLHQDMFSILHFCTHFLWASSGAKCGESTGKHQNKLVHFSPIQQEHRMTLLQAFSLSVTIWFAKDEENLFLSFSIFKVPIDTVNGSSPQENFHFPLYLSQK